ncbi:MAG: LEPR-XLL domain-containing protein, partial [Burkholderiales bacterium]|nr:LEPR-XLL domain-containing protein [Burkholderiales bacterium]
MAKRKNWWQKLQHGLRGSADEASASPKPEQPLPSREKLVFEHLEPRLLLSDTPIPLATFSAAGTLTINVHSGDLKVETVYSGGTPQIRVWDNTLGTSLGQVALTQNVKVSINGLPGISDKVQVDLGYDDGAAGTNPTTPFAVMVELDGGTDIPLVSDDTLTFQSSGPDFYNPTALFLKSSDDIVFASNFSTTGTLNVDSQEAITVSGVSLQASDMYLGVTKAVTDGVTLLDGFNLLGNASGAITLTNATVTAGDVGLIVNTSVNVNTTDSSYASNLIKVAFVQTSSNAQITLAGATNLSATAGKLTLASTSTVTAHATTQPDANSTASDKDASIASAIVSSAAGVTVGGTSSLTASGALILKSTNTVDVAAVADGTAGANANGAKGGTVAVT